MPFLARPFQILSANVFRAVASSAAIAVTLITASCTSTKLDTSTALPSYTDTGSTQKIFAEHQSEFENVKDKLLKEPDSKLIYTGKGDSKNSTAKLSTETQAACDKLMAEVHAFTVMKLSGAVRFGLDHAHERNRLKELSITYDPQRLFTQPKSKFGVKRSLQELAPNWFFVADTIDTTNFPIHAVPKELRTKP